MTEITIKVEGKQFGGFESATVTRSMNALSHSFNFTAINKWTDDPANRKILPGSECEILVGGQKVTTGYIDSMDPSFEAESNVIAYSGRSKTSDLVDCAIVDNSGSFNNLTVQEIADKLCKPFGIDVVMESATNPKIKKFAFEEGASPYETLSKLVTTNKLILQTNADGNLVITEISTEKLPDLVLEYGENIKSGSGAIAISGRFNKYVCKSQFPGLTTEIEAIVFDSTVPRFRPFLIVSEESADGAQAKLRAEWELQQRRAQSIGRSYNVQDWTWNGTDIWTPNTNIRIIDPTASINRMMLLTDVSQSYANGGGTETSLTFAQNPIDGISAPEGFDIWPA